MPRWVTAPWGNMNILPHIVAKPLPCHTGILRDETLVLPKLFGVPSSEIPTAAAELEGIELGQNFQDTLIKDVVLVAIDIDTFQGYEKIIPDQQFHFGISILDTRSIHDAQLTSHTLGGPANIIRSYQYTVGSSKYCHRASRKFLFGESESATLSNLKSKLESIIPTRDIITIFHGGNSDIKFLRRLQIDLQGSSISSASTLPTKSRESIRLPWYPIYKSSCCRNDAHFILRTLLMLVAIDAEKHRLELPEGLLQALRAVAMAPLPSTRAEIESPIIEARRKAKAEKKSLRKTKRAERTARRKLERENWEPPSKGETPSQNNSPNPRRLYPGP
ncbi:hypothetical protein F4779DRAFT_592863 [Xylariaceae sp. FL0662B]|nr:hypothetical protein F4779DRAFT_592863 [Xylariaceae sp. FL0662B]